MPRTSLRRAALYAAAPLALLTTLAPLPLAADGPSASEVAAQVREVGTSFQLRAQLKRERLHAKQTFHRLRLSVLTRPSVDSAIHLAAVTFGVDEARMRRVIFRESRFRPWAHNRRSTACGLGQFLNSTWDSTPQGAAGLPCEDGYANAMAMAWMIRYGKGGWHHWDLTAW